jgi:hypothetical protein
MVFGKCVKCGEMKGGLVKAGYRDGKQQWLCQDCILAKYPKAIFANEVLEGPAWVIEEVLKA